MNRLAFLALGLSLGLSFGLGACGDNLRPPGGGGGDGGNHDDGGGDDDGGGGNEGQPSRFTILASFDPAMGQQAEGVLSVGGTVYATLPALGQVVKLNPDKTFAVFGTFPVPVNNTFTLGLAADAQSNIYVLVAATGALPSPPPGVYRIPAAGGTATLFASNAAMTFPNAIEFDGTNFYVTDSAAGRVFKIAANGNVQTWLNNVALAGDMAACGGTGLTFKIGANGIASDGTNRYVAVTDFGRIVKVPISPTNGNAGTPTVLAESCDTLQGADGIVLDDDGSLIVVRNGPSNTMTRVSADGATVTPLHVGAPLDGPASIVIDNPGTRRAVITNSAFFSGATGKPSVVAYEL